MKIPKTIKIHGLDWKISIEPPEKFRSNLDGECIYDKLTIRLRGGMALDYTWQVLWHEIFHAVNSQLVEVDVEWFGLTVNAILKENKWLKN